MAGMAASVRGTWVCTCLVLAFLRAGGHGGGSGWVAGQMANGPTFSETKCIDDLVVAYMKDGKVLAANVAFLRQGKVVYAQGYGTRDVPGIGPLTHGRATMPQTPFRVASVSKSITALTVLRLVEAGKMGLDDVVFRSGGHLGYMTSSPKRCCRVTDTKLYVDPSFLLPLSVTRLPHTVLRSYLYVDGMCEAVRLISLHSV